MRVPDLEAMINSDVFQHMNSFLSCIQMNSINSHEYGRTVFDGDFPATPRPLGRSAARRIAPESVHRHQDFTAPPVAPAATYFCATTSRIAAGREAMVAVAMTEPQSATKPPMYW